MWDISLIIINTAMTCVNEAAIQLTLQIISYIWYIGRNHNCIISAHHIVHSIPQKMLRQLSVNYQHENNVKWIKMMTDCLSFSDTVSSDLSDTRAVMFWTLCINSLHTIFFRKHFDVLLHLALSWVVKIILMVDKGLHIL